MCSMMHNAHKCKHGPTTEARARAWMVTSYPTMSNKCSPAVGQVPKSLMLRQHFDAPKVLPPRWLFLDAVLNLPCLRDRV